MEPHDNTIVAHPKGERATVEVRSAIADTFPGRIHVEWDATAPVTPFGQLPFFIDFLKQGGLFDRWVADCPQFLTSNNAPKNAGRAGPVCGRCWPAIAATPTSPRCAAIRLTLRCSACARFSARMP